MGNALPDTPVFLEVIHIQYQFGDILVTVVGNLESTLTFLSLTLNGGKA